MSGPLGVLTPGFKEELLTGCIKDIPGCLMTCICPHIVLSLTRTHVDGRECGIFDCLCGASPYAVRQAIRHKNGVPKNALMDCLAICLCGVCTIYQNAKESGAKLFPTPEEMKRL